MWILNTVVSILLLTIYIFSNEQESPAKIDLFIKLFLLIGWVITIYFYQESTKSQSLQMYHLIPISGNFKFLSKQFITFFAFPAIILSVTYFIAFVANLFAKTDNLSEVWPNSQEAVEWLLVWILWHSISTFFAIIFKKNKVIYSMLTYFLSQISIATFFYLISSLFNTDLSFRFSWDSAGDQLRVIYGVGILLLSAVFYGISYHLFFRRQL